MRGLSAAELAEQKFEEFSHLQKVGSCVISGMAQIADQFLLAATEMLMLLMHALGDTSAVLCHLQAHTRAINQDLRVTVRTGAFASSSRAADGICI